MQIILNEEATKRVNELRARSKERGLKKKTWDEVLSELILKQKNKVWDDLIDQYTSDSYFLERAFNDPEARKELLRVIKKSKPLNHARIFKDQKNCKGETQDVERR